MSGSNPNGGAPAEVAAFNDECNKVAETGRAAHENFDEKLSTLWTATNGLDPQTNAFTPLGLSIVESAIETGAADQVLNYLGVNPSEAIRIANIRSNSARAVAIQRLATTITTPVAPPAPPPPDMNTKNMDQWLVWRAQQGDRGSRTSGDAVEAAEAGAWSAVGDQKSSIGDWITRRNAQVAARGRR